MKKISQNWPLIVSVSALYSIIVVPLKLLKEDLLPESFIVFDLIASGIFIFEFYRPIQNKNFKSPLEIILAALAALPLELLQLFPQSPKALALMSLMRTFALLRAYKEISENRIHFRFYKLHFIVVSVISAVHLITCSWLALNPMNELSMGEAYLRSLYWTITTLTTTGYGDITPTTDGGRLFTIFVMITGFSAFGIIVGNISNLLMAKNRHSEANKEKLEDLSLFMHHYEVPYHLQEDVLKFYHQKIKKRLSHNDGKIIADLPLALQKEVSIYMKIKLIREIPIFKDLSKDCLTMIAKALEQVSFSADETIIKIGDHGEEMYIVDHGEVVVLNENDEPVAALRHGQCFGEIALLMEVTRTAKVTTSNYCDAYRFKKRDFLKICRSYPELERSLRQVMERRIQDKKAA